MVKAKPDGNTLGFVSNNHVVNPSIYKEMPFDSLADITPIAVVGSTPFVLVANPRLPVKDAKELQALLKAKPGLYNYASSGNGTIIHLAGAQFLDAADVHARHIPYKGMGAMVTDIIAGNVEFGVVALPVALPHVKVGSLRAIGVLGKSRARALPEVPSMEEQGFPGVDIGGWFAFIGPAKMDAAEVTRLNKAVIAAFAMPEAVQAMNNQENVINPMSPEEDASINAGIAADMDTYELSKDEFKQLKRVGRPKSASPKIALTVRYDADIIEAFKAGGEGWQTRMNSALRDWLRTHRA